MSRDDAHHYERMMQMITGSWVTQIVGGAAHFGLADVLASRSLDLEETARACGCDREIMFRFLRACISLGLVAEQPDKRFASTPLMETLREADPRSLRWLALAQAAPGHWLPWGRFTDVLATGSHQTVEALGSEVFDYYDAHPREGADFSRAMSGLTRMWSHEIAKILKTDGVQRAVDVGGAEGVLLLELMKGAPALHGVIFDRPDVVANARPTLDFSQRDRIEMVGGDFFVEIPTGDLYLLKFILHDWGDEECVRILRNCRRAMSPSGRVAIMELELGEVGEGGRTPLMDINMMVLGTGRERTIAEYACLLQAAGFGDVRATSTGMQMVLIEAFGFN